MEVGQVHRKKRESFPLSRKRGKKNYEEVLNFILLKVLKQK